MRPPPRLDLVLAAVLVVLVVVETLANEEAPRPLLRAVLAAVDGRRRWRSGEPTPLRPQRSSACGMTAESLATESPDEGGILFAILLVAYSVGAHLSSARSAAQRRHSSAWR